mgnify:CR=1 FL=1
MKHTRTPIHRLANIGRKVLLAIFIIALGSIYLWNFQPQAIHFIDKRIVKLYKHQYKKMYRSAKATATKDGSKGLALAINLAGKLSNTKKMDRLAPIKRKNFELITSTYEQSGSYPQALEWLDKWIAFDGKDLLAKTRNVEVMLKIPNKYDEGMKRLSDLYQRVPGSEFIAEAYIRALLSEKKYTDALKVSRNYKLKNYTSFKSHWQIYWDLGDGFTAEQMDIVMPKVDGNGSFHLALDLPPEVKQVRLDPPPEARYKIITPTLHYMNENLELWKQPLNVNDAWLTSNGIITSGGNDPYFYWKIPHSYLTENKMFFTARIGLAPLPGFESAFLGPSSDEFKSTIIQTEDKDLIAEFYTVMQDTKFAQAELGHSLSLGIYWSKNKEAFTEKKTATINTKIHEGQFEATLPIEDHIEKLRVDFPSTDNVTYVIKKLKIIRKKAFENVDVTNLDLILKNDLHFKNGAFLVTGDDPHFAIKTAPAYVESILIQGVTK